MIFDDIFQTVKEFNMIQTNDHVIIGLSGGADSVFLLHFLCWIKEALNIQITAVHVNHNLRKEARSDEKFVRLICENLEVPLEVFSYNISGLSKSMKQGIEETGRKMRYTAFEEAAVRHSADKIAVAHNINDNTETVIMNLCRGSGMKGMCGIPPVRGKVIRPLIGTERKDIEAYLKESGISYLTDQTNLEPTYARNKVRLNIVPELDSLSGEALNSIVFRNCRLISEENEFFERMAEYEYIKCMCCNESPTGKNIVFDAKKLEKLAPVIGRRVIRLALSKEFSISNITFEQSNNILSLTQRQTGKRFELPNGLEAFREYDRIIIRARRASESFCYNIELNMLYYIREIDKYIVASKDNRKSVTNLQLLYTRLFDYDKIKNSLELRTRRAGDVIYVEKMGGTKKLKDFFIDNKVPREQRDREPLLTDGSTVIWLVERKLANSNYEVTNSEDKNLLYVSIWRYNT